MRLILGACIVTLLFLAPSAGADLVGGPDILPAAPASVIDDFPGAENDHQQGFNEKQDHTLGSRIEIDNVAPFIALSETELDSGSLFIKVGTFVDSHMIFYNTVGSALTADFNRTWKFAGPILGIMSDVNGVFEQDSNAEVRAPGTIYPGSFFNRGMEGADGYTVSADRRSITVDMEVAEPGDWIRVITTGQPVPEPSTLALCGLAVGLIVWRRRKRTV